jgi:hydroxypyruvate reductase
MQCGGCDDLKAWRLGAEAAYKAVVSAGQPQNAMATALTEGDLSDITAVLAIGKAAHGMAAAAYHAGLSQRAKQHGLIIAPNADMNANWPVIVAGHPVPDQGSYDGGMAAAELVSSLGKDDHLLLLLSGGASAMMVLPQPPITLDQKMMLNERLLASGADIHDINAIRRLVSGIKGGRLAAMAAPARITQHIISDVENDTLAAIGSGPAAADPVPMDQVMDSLNHLGLMDIPWLRAYLDGLHNGQAVPPLRHGDARLDQVTTKIVASNNQLVHDGLLPVIAKAGGITSYQTMGFPRLSGEAVDMGRHLAEITMTKHPCDRVSIGVSGGETTVTLSSDHGKGGRSQELALSFALSMMEVDFPWVILAAGTDGRDGPTNAAGAILDSTMPLYADAMANALRRHDSWTYLDQTDGLFLPGASGTNIADMVVILAGPS